MHTDRQGMHCSRFGRVPGCDRNDGMTQNAINCKLLTLIGSVGSLHLVRSFRRFHSVVVKKIPAKQSKCIQKKKKSCMHAHQPCKSEYSPKGEYE